jgi:hypothetical protein
MEHLLFEKALEYNRLGDHKAALEMLDIIEAVKNIKPHILNWLIRNGSLLWGADELHLHLEDNEEKGPIEVEENKAPEEKFIDDFNDSISSAVSSLTGKKDLTNKARRNLKRGPRPTKLIDGVHMTGYCDDRRGRVAKHVMRMPSNRFIKMGRPAKEYVFMTPSEDKIARKWTKKFRALVGGSDKVHWREAVAFLHDEYRKESP